MEGLPPETQPKKGYQATVQHLEHRLRQNWRNFVTIGLLALASCRQPSKPPVTNSPEPSTPPTDTNTGNPDSNDAGTQDSNTGGADRGEDTETPPTPIIPIPTETQGTPEGPEIYATLTDNTTGVKILIDAKHTPFAYETSDGIRQELNYEAMQEAQQQAVETGLPTIAFTLPSAPSESEYTPLPEKPLTPSLPEDVLSDEELQTRGIAIVSTPETTLHIRPGAFEPGEFFEKYTGEQLDRLTIFLIPGPSLSPHYFPNDPRLDTLRNSLIDQYGEPRTDTDTFRQEMLAQVRQDQANQIQIIEQAISDASGNEGLLKDAYIDLLYQEYYYLYASEAAIREEMLSTQVDNILGVRHNTGSDPTSHIIAIAVGSIPPSGVDNDVYVFDESGNLSSISYTDSSYSFSSVPRVFQTHPTPEDYFLDPFASPDYPERYRTLYYLGGPHPTTTGPGYVMRHEASHVLQADAMRADPSLQDPSEYGADTAALESLARAAEKWAVGDDSGYYFVFSTPDGNYILSHGLPPHQPAIPTADRAVILLPLGMVLSRRKKSLTMRRGGNHRSGNIPDNKSMLTKGSSGKNPTRAKRSRQIQIQNQTNARFRQILHQSK